jgi:hypothetical protein
MATSFSGGRSQSTWREPPTMGKQLVSFITCYCKSIEPFFAQYFYQYLRDCALDMLKAGMGVTAVVDI